MICQFKKTFLRDLAELPATYRKRIEKLVFEDFPGMNSLSDKLDDLVKSRNSIKFVIPAKAGIQLFQDVLDPGFRRGDASRDFLRDHQT